MPFSLASLLGLICIRVHNNEDNFILNSMMSANFSCNSFWPQHIHAYHLLCVFSNKNHLCYPLTSPPIALQWSQSCFMPSLLFTTYCCTRKVPRWLFALLMVFRRWSPCWQRIILNSWLSPLTVCSCLPMEIKKAKYWLIFYPWTTTGAGGWGQLQFSNLNLPLFIEYRQPSQYRQSPLWDTSHLMY